MASCGRRWVWRTVSALASMAAVGAVAGWYMFHTGRSDLRTEMADPEVIRCLTITPRVTAPMPTGDVEAFFLSCGRFGIANQDRYPDREPMQYYMYPYLGYPRTSFPFLSEVERRLLHAVVVRGETALMSIQCSQQLDTPMGDASNALTGIAALDIAMGDPDGLRLLDALTRIADADDNFNYHIMIDRARSRGLLIAHISGALGQEWDHWATHQPELQSLFPRMLKCDTLQTSPVRKLLYELAGRDDDPYEDSRSMSISEWPFGPGRAARWITELNATFTADWKRSMTDGLITLNIKGDLHSDNLAQWIDVTARDAAYRLSCEDDGDWRACQVLAALIIAHQHTGFFPDSAIGAIALGNPAWWHGTNSYSDLHYYRISKDACMLRVGPWRRSPSSIRIGPDPDEPEDFDKRVDEHTVIVEDGDDEWRLNFARPNLDVSKEHGTHPGAHHITHHSVSR